MVSQYIDTSRFKVVDARRAEDIDHDASIIVTDDQRRSLRLDLSAEMGELLCLRIAEALEDRYDLGFRQAKSQRRR